MNNSKAYIADHQSAMVKLAEDIAGQQHDQRVATRDAKAKAEHRNLFCVKYHYAKQKQLCSATGGNAEVDQYFQLLIRQAAVVPVESTRHYTAKKGYGDNHPGVKSHQLKVAGGIHPSEYHDMVYHGSQFHRGEW